MDFKSAVYRINHIPWSALGKTELDSKKQLELGAEYLRRMANFFREQSLTPINPLLTNIAAILGDKEPFQLTEYCSIETEKSLENKSLLKAIVTFYLQLSKYSQHNPKAGTYLPVYEPLIQLMEAGASFGYREGGLLFYQGGFCPLHNWYERFGEQNLMNYIYFTFEEEQFFIELDYENYAQRQIILYPNGTYMISCIDDCLVEGQINFEGITDITTISSALFESKWDALTASYRNQWNLVKENYPVGQCITGIIKYFYPQGARVQLGTVQGLISDNCGNTPNFIDCVITGVVSGYDEQNMWVVLDHVSEIDMEDCLKPVISLLRSAFPCGIDEKNYFLLLHLLYHDLCDEHLARVMSLVMDQPEAVISNDVAKAFYMDFNVTELQSLETWLKTHGLDKLRKEP